MSPGLPYFSDPAPKISEPIRCGEQFSEPPLFLADGRIQWNKYALPMIGIL